MFVVRPLAVVFIVLTVVHALLFMLASDGRRRNKRRLLLDGAWLALAAFGVLVSVTRLKDESANQAARTLDNPSGDWQPYVAAYRGESNESAPDMAAGQAETAASPSAARR